MIFLIELFLGVSIVVLPLACMRIPGQVGDWILQGRTISVAVADTGNWRCNFLLALHEAVEARLCVRHGVQQVVVDEWDQRYAARRARQLFEARASGLVDAQFAAEVWPEEAGDAPMAPYHREHVWATHVERVASLLLLVRWQGYERVLRRMVHES